jgi:hypothetical protein
VGAWTEGSAANIVSGGANTSVDFDLLDSNGKVLAQARQQYCTTTIGSGGPKAITCQEVCRVYSFYQSGVFTACHAGWMGTRIGSSGLLPGPRVCVGFRASNQELDYPTLSQTYVDWLPVVGDLATVKATIQPSRVTTNPAPQNEFQQVLVVFVQSMLFPALF